MDVFFWKSKKSSVDKDIDKLKALRGRLNGLGIPFIYSSDLLQGTKQTATNMETELLYLFGEYEVVKESLLRRSSDALTEIDNLIAQMHSQSCALEDEISKNEEVS